MTRPCGSVADLHAVSFGNGCGTKNLESPTNPRLIQNVVAVGWHLPVPEIESSPARKVGHPDSHADGLYPPIAGHLAPLRLTAQTGFCPVSTKSMSPALRGGTQRLASRLILRGLHHEYFWEAAG